MGHAAFGLALFERVDVAIAEVLPTTRASMPTRSGLSVTATTSSYSTTTAPWSGPSPTTSTRFRWKPSKVWLPSGRPGPVLSR